MLNYVRKTDVETFASQKGYIEKDETRYNIVCYNCEYENNNGTYEVKPKDGAVVLSTTQSVGYRMLRIAVSTGDKFVVYGIRNEGKKFVKYDKTINEILEHLYVKTSKDNKVDSLYLDAMLVLLKLVK